MAFAFSLQLRQLLPKSQTLLLLALRRGKLIVFNAITAFSRRKSTATLPVSKFHERLPVRRSISSLLIIPAGRLRLDFLTIEEANAGDASKAE
jgi:hypothetical protein